MDTWGIIGVLAGVLSLLVTILVLYIKSNKSLNTTITRLSCAVESLEKFVDSNDKCHDEFSRSINNHETRISVIEDWRKSGVK